MEVTTVQPSSSNQEQAKRVACTRCRAQKLKCVKSTPASASTKCDRCSKANTECNYAASRPVGRPRTGQSRRAHAHGESLSSKSSPQSMATVDNHQLHLDDEYLNTFFETTDSMLSAQGFDMLCGDPMPSPEQSECPNRDAINEPSLLTPLSSNGRLPFWGDSNSGMGALSAESLPPAAEAESTADPRRTMQHLADLGLDLHPKIAKYQKASDDELMRDLVGDALRSSTDYLNTLLLLVASFTNAQPGTDGHPPQLDMPAAFQVLIPYVRLVQLHSILFEAILRRLTGAAVGGAPRSVFPDIWVGGVCVNAGGLFRERLMLQISTHLLAEIETVLELPDEARMCGPEPGSSGGGPKGTAASEGGAHGILRKAVSPRLLKMILDECDMGSTDVQSTRERIACIKRLLRCSPL